MWCYNLTKNHGLLLLIYIIVGIDSLTSSTADCDCSGRIVQNAKCSKQTNCTLVCNDGYWGTDCKYGRIRLTSSRGYITDGVESYPVLSKRMWLIDSGNRVNASIHFQIEEFFTECNWDHVYIFDGDSTDSSLLAAFNGYLVGDVNSSSYGRIPQEIIAKSGRAYIYFYSDLGVVQSGFNISYRILDNCPCLNGKCNTAGLCVCDVGWTGSLCDVQKNCSCINGACNQTFGNCVCNDGFAGNDCSQPITSSFWTSIKTKNSGAEISPRSSHAAAIIGDHMWVYNGYRFSHPGHGAHRNLYRYHLKDKTWTSLPQEEDDYTWGHSMVAYQGKLIVFGGEREDHVIVNTLAVFDTNSSKWSRPPSLNSTHIAVTGHTATLVEDKMIVIFGLSVHGLFPGVQEYDIGKSTWQVIKSKSALGVARHGHTSVYDPFSKRIYVYGGVTMATPSSFAPSDSLTAYYPHSRTWITLASSEFRQTLHSAVILDRMMIVFGGNPYVNKDSINVKCHTTKLHVYDLACQKWYSEDLPQIAQTLARYGHTAVAKGRLVFLSHLGQLSCLVE
ncbi:attractin 1 [Paramuricea clavata]|uniref:Attractin 1 n=1 Tax=Paramuricea clavata TaxID=317549 RepID=A0A7D9HVZ5_PARCT|nr:attractin 1 [Paramuricea clavata]